MGWIMGTLALCDELGYRTTPVFEDGATKPFKDGQDYKNPRDYVNAHHIGLVLDDCVLLDYDGNKGDPMAVEELEEVLGYDFLDMPEWSQRKGDSIHWLFKCSEEGLAASCDGWKPFIDIKRGNQLMHLKQGKELQLVADLPDAPGVLVDALRRSETVEDDLGDFAGLIPESETPAETVRAWLAKLDHNMPNSEWVKVGQALHEWDSVQGLALWEEWSCGGATWKEGECEKRWRSFSKGGGVTLGTVAHMAKVADFEEAEAEIRGIQDRIARADEREIKLSLFKEVAALDVDKFSRELLAKSFQDRIKVLTGVKMPIGEIRGNITPVSGELAGAVERPEWCGQWVYVNSHQGFMNLNGSDVYKKEAFNLMHGKHIPPSDNGRKMAASSFVADNGFVEIVDSTAYLPMEEDKVLQMGGKKVYNTFDRRTLPVAADRISDEGLEAIEHIVRHAEIICGGDKEDAYILMQWLAHQVQYPGVKVLWSPIIQSVQGVGKSFFGRLLGACLGRGNVGTVNPSQVTSDKNGWATDVCVNVLEELRIKGHNRYEVVNAIKPLITDDVIQICDKYVKAYSTRNTTNYICFTNHRDAIPLTEDDRRWWVIWSKIEKLEDLETITGLTKEVYFDQLFDGLRKHGSEIKRWLLDYEISAEFKAMKQAPMTKHKEMMIATEAADHPFREELKELICKGGEMVAEACFSSADLFDVATFEIEGINDLNARQKNAILKDLGYSQIKNPVKLKGKARRIWVKHHMSNDDIRAILT